PRRVRSALRICDGYGSFDKKCVLERFDIRRPDILQRDRAELDPSAVLTIDLRSHGQSPSVPLVLRQRLAPFLFPMPFEVGRPQLFDRDRRVNSGSRVLTFLARARLPLIDGVLPRRELLFGLRLRRELAEHEPMPFVGRIPRMFTLAPFLRPMAATLRKP